MAQWVGQCQRCVYSSRAFGSPFRGGWCDRFDKPIGNVKFNDCICTHRTKEIDSQILYMRKVREK
jgi:hypothetical protein